MKVLVRSSDSRTVLWGQRGIERLRQALDDLRLLAVSCPPAALALIPIRAAQPQVTRQRHQHRWRD